MGNPPNKGICISGRKREIFGAVFFDTEFMENRGHGEGEEPQENQSEPISLNEPRLYSNLRGHNELTIGLASF
jgi:hypothetical protein